MNPLISSSSSAIVLPPVAALPMHPTQPIGVHPAAELFPMMKDADLGLLVEDIDEHGLREPILVYQGLVLDGRNRLRACEIAGVEPRFIEWDGVGSPLAIVLSRNLHRRHLNEGQRAIIAARAKGMFEEEAAERERAHQFGRGGRADNEVEGGSVVDTPSPQPSPEERGSKDENTAGANLRRPGRSNDQAAELLNVSPRSVVNASRVLKSADEQVIAVVESGDVAVSDAAAIAGRPKEEQRQALEAKRDGRARTLRQAAETEFGPQSAASPSGKSSGATPRQLRAEATRFVRQLERIIFRLDALCAVFGPSDQTQQMRDCLHRLIDLFHDFARCHLRTGK